MTWTICRAQRTASGRSLVDVGKGPKSTSSVAGSAPPTTRVSTPCTPVGERRPVRRQGGSGSGTGSSGGSVSGTGRCRRADPGTVICAPQGSGRWVSGRSAEPARSGGFGDVVLRWSPAVWSGAAGAVPGGRCRDGWLVRCRRCDGSCGDAAWRVPGCCGWCYAASAADQVMPLVVHGVVPAGVLVRRGEPGSGSQEIWVGAD